MCPLISKGNSPNTTRCLRTEQSPRLPTSASPWLADHRPPEITLAHCGWVILGNSARLKERKTIKRRSKALVISTSLFRPRVYRNNRPLFCYHFRLQGTVPSHLSAILWVNHSLSFPILLKTRVCFSRNSVFKGDVGLRFKAGWRGFRICTVLVGKKLEFC